MRFPLVLGIIRLSNGSKQGRIIMANSKRPEETQTMIEGIAKLMWILLSGAFIFGAWSSTLEFRTQDHSDRIVSLESRWDKNQEKIIDVLGRIDERLKSLERR